jgi:hypothetical protein
MSAEVEIVKRESIPPMRAAARASGFQLRGELRDFRWSAELRRFLQPASQVDFGWVAMSGGDVQAPRVHTVETLFVVYGGSGEAVGELQQPLEAGQILAIPAGCSQGLAAGPAGLQLLKIQLSRNLTIQAEASKSDGETDGALAALLALNEACLSEFKRTPVFELLNTGSLATASKRVALSAALSALSEGYVSALVARQASCSNPRFASMFLLDLRRALSLSPGPQSGEDASQAPRRRGDTRLDAMTAWFTYQMHVLDDVEKAAMVHLTLERAQTALLRAAQEPLLGHFHPQLRMLLESKPASGGVSVEALRCQSLDCYARLQDLSLEAWRMLRAIGDRMASIASSA